MTDPMARNLGLDAELLDRDRLPIGGGWVTVLDGDRLDVVNPATGGRVGSCPIASPSLVDRACAAARDAFDTGPWPHYSPAMRADVLRRIHDRYYGAVSEMQALITVQNGSPLTFDAQVGHPLGILDYYARLALDYPWIDPRAGFDIHREPVGVVAIIVPWNMPQKTIMMKLAPALLAGCTVVIKPAPQTPLDALLLADLLTDVGLPPGVVNVVPGGPVTGQALVASPHVDKVAFTGSTVTGKWIARLAAGRCARVSLELGGKSAAIVLPDADPTAVVEALRTDAFLLSGQICSAHTRVLVPDYQHDQYTIAIVQMATSLIVGDPTVSATEIGPLVSELQRDRVLAYIRTGIDEKATLACGSADPRPGPGWYVTPTVFAHVDPDMTIAREEIFGPVVCVIPYADVQQAVEIANDSSYGLEAGVWSTDPAAAARVARRLRVGTVRINGKAAPISSPLGGFKQSGIGRELGPEGLAGYLETKAIIR